MLVEVSIGEVVDKYSILEIKKNLIKNPIKLKEITKELEALESCTAAIISYPDYYYWLVYVNMEIWNHTDTIKQMPVTHPDFATIAQKIFDLNQQRFRIKSFFNQLVGSTIQEQKSYQATYIVIQIDTPEELMEKFAEINHLSIQYDYVRFDCAHTALLQTYFKQPHILWEQEIIEEKESEEHRGTTYINIRDYTITNPKVREVFSI